MKTEVSSAIEELKLQFSSSAVTASEDGQGGAHVFLEVINLGPGFRPDHTWVGFQIPAQYPYADIYPVFVVIQYRIAAVALRWAAIKGDLFRRLLE